MRGLGAGLKGAAADALKVATDDVPSTPAELIARAKVLNKEGRYKRAVELIEEAYALQPKISTALSAANLRLRLGDFDQARAAYRRVLGAAGTAGGPNEAELAMAVRKLKEAEEGARLRSVAISLLERPGEPRSLRW